MRLTLFLSLPLGLLCLLASFPATGLAANDWKPVDPAHLTLKEPVVEKDADAEALFWEVKVNDDPNGDLIFTHYLRIKVFSERGRETQSKIDIPFGRLFGSEIRIRDIAARTIKTDGSIVELKKDDVLERTIVKASGVKVKAKSFAMPAVEPGCIIEYRWREIRVNQSANYVRLDFQRDIPVQHVKYFIKPYPFEGLAMRSLTMNGSGEPFAKEKGGYYSTTMTNVPALYQESRMPPENEIKTWMLIFYARDNKSDPDKYWSDFGKRIYDSTKSLLKVNDVVRQKATELTSGATSDEEKVDRLFHFCRTEIRNVSRHASELTTEERKKLKENKSPSDTLKRGMGYAGDIDLLFASLATAVGFDARIVLAPDRGQVFFNRNLPNAYFLNASNIAVRVGQDWRFYNPGYTFVPPGMLRWQEEGTPSLITDPKQPVWVNTPLSGHDKSQVKRNAKLSLTEDGVLEGQVTIEFTGHFAIDRKVDFAGDTPNQREEDLREEIKARMSTAEVTDIRIENITDSLKPLTYSYRLRVPGYAQRTGKRLFLQPALFQRGSGPLFATSTRKYDIYFPYPWSESDEVTINLPAGYVLDNADAPAPFGAASISDYKPSLRVTSDGRMLIYSRSFFFGAGGNILFPAKSYSQLKNYFDVLHQQDGHTVTLKQDGATASN